ncbi:MAG: MBL fold metallo-hydrolase [Alphaproteobacteria bacterium]|nr:MBL fold metallo-hydrolase [Alphaproteobacteria bacterium]
MRLQFLGSGDAFGSGGRFNTCFHLERSAHGNVLIDCGASSMIAIRKWQVDPNVISTIVVTHLHGDHFGGIPFFLLDAQLIIARMNSSSRRHTTAWSSSSSRAPIPPEPSRCRDRAASCCAGRSPAD